MNPVTAAVLKTGIVSPALLAQMRRFNPMFLPDNTPDVPVDLETAGRLIADALQTEQYVLMRETDLSVVQKYIQEPKRAVLKYLADGAEADIDVTYVNNALGEYVFAWKGESISAAMTNGETHLVVDDVAVYFMNVRELFFGEQKAFMVCQPSSVEARDGVLP